MPKQTIHYTCLYCQKEIAERIEDPRGGGYPHKFTEAICPSCSINAVRRLGTGKPGAEGEAVRRRLDERIKSRPRPRW